MEPEDERFSWIVAFGIIFGFFMAWGIGANDVANSFGSSVGSKALTLKQAVIVATICEFVGCVTMGASVTDTVRKGIVNADYLKDNPEVLQLGMLAALLGAGTWLALCSYLGCPVSTTHSIIGSLIGVSLTVNPASLNSKTVGMVVLSWVSSPMLSGILAAGLFLIIRTLILRKDDAVARGYKFFPILLFFAFSVMCLYTVFKNPQVDLKAWRKESPHFAVLLGFGVALIGAGITYASTINILRSRVEAAAEKETTASKGEGEAVVPETKEDAEAANTDAAKPKTAGVGWNQDLHAQCQEDGKVQEIHNSAETFASQTEGLFSFLQVISAAFGSLAHGANDVANSVGPLAAIWGVYEAGEVSSKVDVPIWILVLGGAGISIGLLTYGYNVIKAIGIKLTKISPSRGFCIEMGMSIVVIIGSNLGIPLSTTHCQVGATVGVGLCEIGGFSTVRKGVNWKLMGKVFAMWVLTLVFAAIVASSFFGFLTAGYHPMSQALDCGPLSQALADRGNIAVYTENDMKALFAQLDTNNDGELLSDELEAAGLDMTVDGEDLVVEKYGRRRRRTPDEMDEDDFLAYTCMGDSSLDHVNYKKCEPQCPSGTNTRANSDLKCKLIEDVDDSGGFRLSAVYSGFSGCEPV